MPRPELPPLPDDAVDHLNAIRGGFNALIGLRFTAASYDRLECTVPVTEQLHQPYGLVHGGVYAAIVETMASSAAALQGMHQGIRIVGLENSTSFMKATRSGTLTAVATPLSVGRRTQVWQVEITNDEGKLAASGKVRLLALEPEAELAGSTLEARSSK